MKFFDTHCDTVKKVMDHSLDFQTGEGKGHVSLPGMIAANSCAQVFACFVLSERYPGKERETAEGMIRTIGEMAARSEGKMEVVRTCLRPLCSLRGWANRGTDRPGRGRSVGRRCRGSSSLLSVGGEELNPCLAGQPILRDSVW